jgi:phage-related protein
MEIEITPEVAKFMKGLEKTTKMKVSRSIDLLRKYGNRLPMPYSKSLKNGVFELRIHGKQEIRLLYGFSGDGVTIVYGFIKKTQKTPKSIIERAIAELNLRKR